MPIIKKGKSKGIQSTHWFKQVWTAQSSTRLKPHVPNTSKTPEPIRTSPAAVISLHNAIAKLDVDAVNRLLAAHVDPNTKDSEYSQTPLGRLARGPIAEKDYVKAIAIAKALLNAKADANLTDFYDVPPLSFVKEAPIDFLALFVKNSSLTTLKTTLITLPMECPEALDRFLSVCSSLALRSVASDLLFRLIDTVYYDDTITKESSLIAVVLKHIVKLEKNSAKAIFETKNSYGATLLHHMFSSAHFLNTPILSLMLSAFNLVGATTVNSTNRMGQTPLFYLLESAQTDVLPIDQPLIKTLKKLITNGAENTPSVSLGPRQQKFLSDFIKQLSNQPFTTEPVARAPNVSTVSSSLSRAADRIKVATPPSSAFFHPPIAPPVENKPIQIELKAP